MNEHELAMKNNNLRVPACLVKEDLQVKLLNNNLGVHACLVKEDLQVKLLAIYKKALS